MREGGGRRGWAATGEGGGRATAGGAGAGWIKEDRAGAGGTIGESFGFGRNFPKSPRELRRVDLRREPISAKFYLFY